MDLVVSSRATRPVVSVSLVLQGLLVEGGRVGGGTDFANSRIVVMLLAVISGHMPSVQVT